MSNRNDSSRGLEALEVRRLLATVTGVAFHDLNGNDVRDAGEPAIANAVAYLDLNNSGGTNTIEPAVLTDAEGRFSLTHTAGTYMLRVQFHGSYNSVKATQRARTVQMSDARPTDAGTFGAAMLAELRGKVYNDVDGNGVDTNLAEPGAYALIFKDENGNGAHDTSEPFSFSNSSSGQYVLYTHPGEANILFRPTTGTAAVHQADLSGRTVTLTSGRQVNDNNYAVRRTGTITGRAFDDKNANGVFDGNDVAVGQRVIFVDANNNGVRDPYELSTTTNSFGYFTLAALPGQQRVRQELPAEWVQTKPTAAALSVNVVSDSTINVGDAFASRLQALPVITGTAYDDVNQNGRRDSTEYTVRVGETFYLDLNDDGKLDAGEPSMVTTPSVQNGGFRFTAPAPGTYRLRIIPKAGSFVTQPLPDASYLITVDYNQTASRHFGLATAAPSSISGKVFDDSNFNGVRDAGEKGIIDTGVYLDLDNNGVRGTSEPYASTLDDGAYGFANPPAGTYAVRLASVAGAITFPQSGFYQVTVTNGSQIVNRDFGVARYGTISGNVYDDLDADGVQDTGEPAFPAGHVLFLDADNDGVLDAGEQSTTTDGKGNYYFYRVTPGVHRIRQVLTSGYRQVTPASVPAQVTLPSNGAVTVDFGNTKQPLPTTSVTLQSESAVLSGGTYKSTSHAGYTGAGFADYGGQNSAVTYSLTRASAGAAKLDFRYANGSSARPLQIFVNDVLAGTLNFGPTGGWTTWATTSLTTNLPAGTVTIKAVASTSAGGANVDSLTISSTSGPVDPPPVDPPPVDPPPASGTDIAKGKTTTASSTEKASHNPDLATDGNASTRWSSQYADNQWIMVDLGSSAVLSGVRLAWEAAYGKSYKIQGSNNTSNWTDLFSTTTGDGGVDNINITNTTAWRYVRMLGMTRGTKYGFSLFDFNVYGTGGGGTTPTNPTNPTDPTPPSPATGSISGYLFWDTNKNGKFDSGEVYQAGKEVFIDLDGDNVLDSNERKLTTDANGKFNFTGLAAGTYKIRRVVPKGYKVTTAAQDITITAGQVFSNVAIGTINA